MLNKLFLITAFVLAPVLVYATTGDILFKCSFDGPGTTPTEVIGNCGGNAPSLANSVASIVTGGHDGGKAISYYYPNTGSEVVAGFMTSQINMPEITVDYWERFDVKGSASTIWNVKSIRPFVGPGSSDYVAAIMSRHNSAKWYQSTWGTAKLTITDAVNTVSTSSGYCQGSGSVWACNSGRMEVGFTKDWGTSWHNIKVYIKVPSSDTAADGITKMWIDGKLAYTLESMTKNSLWSSSWVPYTKAIMFHPSDDFFTGVTGNKLPFHHLYDDIKVFEGYVPPPAGVPLSVKHSAM